MGIFYSGLDIGGTKCAAILADETGRVINRAAFATAEADGWRGVLCRLCGLIADMAGENEIIAAGISCGGPLDSLRGIIQSPPNLPGWDDVPATEFIGGILRAPVFLQNDANACALAEWVYGAGRGANSMVFMTFGTGLGAGLILNGKLYDGACGLAGEIGHMRLTDDGPLGYGKHGSYEGWCSGGGLNHLAKMRLGRDLSAKELGDAADAGDKGAQAIYAECGKMLGKGLALIVDMLNPERIVIGSIFARSEMHIRPAMEAALFEDALPTAAKAVKILPAQLGNSIGDIAAITVAVNGVKEKK